MEAEEYLKAALEESKQDEDFEIFMIALETVAQAHIASTCLAPQHSENLHTFRVA